MQARRRAGFRPCRPGAGRELRLQNSPGRAKLRTSGCRVSDCPQQPGWRTDRTPFQEPLFNTVTDETNKPIVLRQIVREPAPAAKEAVKTGILFECLSQTACRHCQAPVTLAGAEPLTTVFCPACGGKVLVPGRVGGFLLYEHIGEGEMGTIYRATDESLQREVAVKLVRGCHADDPESCERLRREARAAGKLNHRRVAQVYALNFSNGNPFLVMELVTGEDFAKKLEREGHIDERTVLQMALDVADGLSALNREGLVHGDIKPGNIVLDRDGNAKLVDFGLSGMTRFDGQGSLVGTPNYIAPELLRGSPDTHRSDLYSLGATLYHLLAGHPPIDGDKTVDVLRARLLRPPMSLARSARHVSAPTQKLVMRMLERDPEKRPPNSEVVAVELLAALRGLDAPAAAAPDDGLGFARRLGAHLRLPRWLRDVDLRACRRALLLLLLALCVLGAGLLAVREAEFGQPLPQLRQQAADAAQRLVRWGRARLPVAAAPERRQPGAKPPAAAPAREADRPMITALPSGEPRPETAALLREAAAAAAAPLWRSVNLGAQTQSGSTMQQGETLIVQGAGTAMWDGHDRCRFVWTKASGDYAFSAQAKAVADTHPLAVTGLLVKGEDPAAGPGLLFGFLGTGELFLQKREAPGRVALVKRSELPFRLPCHLRIVRCGDMFEALVSFDGRSWGSFAACELRLPAAMTVGFAVSSQDAAVLATGAFAEIRLLTLPAPGTR